MPLFLHCISDVIMLIVQRKNFIDHNLVVVMKRLQTVEQRKHLC